MTNAITDFTLITMVYSCPNVLVNVIKLEKKARALARWVGLNNNDSSGCGFHS